MKDEITILMTIVCFTLFTAGMVFLVFRESKVEEKKTLKAQYVSIEKYEELKKEHEALLSENFELRSELYNLKKAPESPTDQ